MSDKIANAFLPITGRAKHRDTLSRLKDRAQRPDLWAAQWSDIPQLLVLHNRIGSIIWIFYCQWPNAFFIPEDDIYTMLDSGYFESLDQVEFIMTLEEIFDVRIDDELANKIFPSPYGKDPTSYRRLLTAMLDIFGPDKDLSGAGHHKWEPLSLPSDHFEQSLWQGLKRRLPFTWTDGSLHRELRIKQATRPQTWANQWSDYAVNLIQLRDRVNRILMDELEWLVDSFIPQDRLTALFHSRYGLEFAVEVLGKINHEFKTEIGFDYITSGRHTYADFLKRLAGAS